MGGAQVVPRLQAGVAHQPRGAGAGEAGGGGHQPSQQRGRAQHQGKISGHWRKIFTVWEGGGRVDNHSHGDGGHLLNIGDLRRHSGQ